MRLDPVGVVARVEANRIARLCDAGDCTTYEIRLRQSMPLRRRIRQFSLWSLGRMLAPLTAALHLRRR